MGIEEELPGLRKGFSQELKDTPDFLGHKVIRQSKVDEAYRKFLNKKYRDKWIDVDYKIFFNDEFFVEKIMKNFGFNKGSGNLGQESFYFKK